MTTDVEINKKSAGPEGATAVPDQKTPSGGAKILMSPFMLEDYVDAVIVHTAINDPDNAEPIPWAQIKEQLGL